MIVRTTNDRARDHDLGPSNGVSHGYGSRADSIEGYGDSGRPTTGGSRSELTAPVERRGPDPVDNGRARQSPPGPRCELTGRCRHPECVDRRAIEAKRLHDTTNLNLREIGLLMGGRDHTIIGDWLRRAA